MNRPDKFTIVFIDAAVLSFGVLAYGAGYI